MTRQKTHTEPVRIQQLAGELIALQSGTGPGATVLLGAGASVASHILAWGGLAAELCRTLSLDTTDTEPESALIEYLHDWRNPHGMRQKIFQKHLKHRQPSIGYSHLAQLVKDGFVTTILTTNWDTLLEKAIFRVLSIDDIKILIRGEVPDDIIAAALMSRHREGHPTVVKLHGDIQSGVLMLGDDETRSFDDKMGQAVRDCLSGTTFVVGQSARDADILTALLSAKRSTGTLYYVRYGDSSELAAIDHILKTAQAKIVTGTQKGVIADGEDVKVGSFDTFFTQLDLAVQVQLTTDRRSQLRIAENSIIQKEATGIGYINYTRITELVRLFTLKVKKLKPQIVLFIDDPSAPGGVELRRRMLSVMRDEQMDIPTATILIQGKGGSRTHKRSVETDLSTLPLENVDSALILDSITFSGNTLRLARDAIREKYPNIDVRVGVLVMSQQLAERQEQTARPADAILHQTITDRYEIFFPWGVTQTTASFARRFEGAVRGQGREVRIERRPWGTIEILADQEITSVRLLTIEAQRRLSFQRHLCRDELFVALDDNIGLDISAEDVERDASEYDERVKSLILEKGDYVLVPRGVWHRTKASMDRVRLLEVGFGLYDQHNDIERRWDDYEREHKDGST